MRYRAVIFDVDGTLLDTLQDIGEAVNNVLKKFGFQEHPLEAYRYFVGDGTETLVRRAFPDQSITKDELTARVEAVKKEYKLRWSRTTRPYPGVPELLDFLEENNIPKALLSNKYHEFVILTVQTLLPRWNFEQTLGVQDGIPPKPDPYRALLLSRKLQVQPEQVVYVGDTGTDMQTAKAAGFYPVGALWGFRSLEELKDNGAALIAEKPTDIIKLFS